MAGFGFPFRKHVFMPELWPLFGAIGFAGTMGSVYLFRLATRGPEVTWSHGGNPEPWQIIKPRQNIKLVGGEVGQRGRPAPDEAYAAIGQ